MHSRKKSIVILLLIIVVAAAAAVFVYQPWWQQISSSRPWSLGLDLVGGSYLIYEIDLSQINASEQDSVVKGLRDVIEKRVNLFGVSEPRVYAENVQGSRRLVVELAGIKELSQAIKAIGERSLLDFEVLIVE